MPRMQSFLFHFTLEITQKKEVWAIKVIRVSIYFYIVADFYLGLSMVFERLTYISLTVWRRPIS